MSMNRHQAVGAYQRWAPPSFDAPAQPQVADLPPVEEVAAPIVEEPPPPPPVPEPLPIPEPEPEPGFKLPTAEDIERIHEEARKDGYAAGYEEGTARGRIEAMQFHSLVESLEKSLTTLDQEVAEEILALSIELARQMVRHTLDAHPEALLETIREALQQLPHTHAQIHVHPDDLAMTKEYLGEQFAQAGHRLVEDAGISRGGARIDAAGSQLDATVQTRWRRIMENLGRNMPWEGE
ncbi:MAG: flagellar assembly protein FliH [Zoogloea sp.]|nr:flagellar assembly protein FliH [Zoogloea sp.]